MKNGKNIAIITIVLAAVVAVLIAKNAGKKQALSDTPMVREVSAVAASDSAVVLPEAAEHGKALPRLVDLGAEKCIPCKMMAPILEELKEEFVNVFEVAFIDVWKNPKAGEQYGVRMIPTQIFFDAEGKELFRHEGFFSKEDILAKWKEFGVEMTK